ncbi:hypothetical protein ABPG72_016226 [Tetrahymena utriculariae]
MDIETKEEYDEHVLSQPNYYLFKFNEKKFNKLQDQEGFYLMLFQEVYQQIINYRLKVHLIMPRENKYESGMCFVLKRPSNSSLGKIINGMNASKYYNCDKGRVSYIGQLVYLDGYFRFNRTLGIRVVRFANKNQLQINEEILKYIDFVLIHIFVRDIQQDNNLKQRVIQDGNQDLSQAQSPQNEDNNQKMESEYSESEEKTYNPPLKKYQKQNNQAGKLIQQENQMYFDNKDIQMKINDETYIQYKQGSEQKRKIILKTNQSKIAKKSSTLESCQQKTEFSQQKIIVNQQNQKIIIKNQQKKENSLCINREFNQNSEENNQMQQMLFLLYIQNNHLQQKLVEKEIQQKKAEIIDLEQKLSKLKQEKEANIRQPGLLNLYQMLSSRQKTELS